MPSSAFVPVATLALVGATVAMTPSAQAAPITVTATSAGTKAVGAATYMWGTSSAPVGSQVCSQVNLSGRWSTSQCSTVKGDHTYAVELTYGKGVAGTYTFHAIVRNASGAITATSSPVTLTRTAPITGWVASSDHEINVRSGPGFTYPVVSHIAGKAKVSGTVSGDWIKISGGYINRGLIETVNSNIYAINGYVPTSSLCAIPLGYNTKSAVSPSYTATTPRYLNCQAVNALGKLEAAYKARFGHDALIDLAYRDHAEQVYWKNTRPNAASPVGTSNHGWGLAVDFREVDDARGNEVSSEFYWGQYGYTWLAQNASKYGFAGDPVPYGTPYESYHWNFVG